MKRTLIALTACLAVISCGQSQQKEADSAIQAVCRYMTELGASYSQGDYCIPYCLIVDTNEENPEDIQIWGDFWVQNYNQVRDTLQTVSGGSHPGCMHVKKTEKGFEVTSFDAVGDGSQFDPTAKAIFGDRYQAMIDLWADEAAKESVRAQSIRDYAKANGLSVSYYQDYGWPAVKIAE